MGRREDSAGPGHSFRPLWIHSFPTSTVSSVLASRPPGCGSLPAGSLSEVATRAGCAIVSRFLFFPKRPALGVPSSTPATSWPPLPPSCGAVAPGQPAFPAPHPCSPTFQVLPVPPLFMTLSHHSGARGKTDGFRESGKFQEDYLQKGLLTKWAEPRGLREPAEESSPPGPAHRGQLPTPGLEGSSRGGPQQMKKKSPRGHLTLTLRAMTFDQVPACPRPPDLPLGHFTGPAH